MIIPAIESEKPVTRVSYQQSAQPLSEYNARNPTRKRCLTDTLAMELPEVIFPGSQSSDNQPLYPRGEEDGPPLPTHPHIAGPPKPKVPNIYVKKPHRKQPALGLFSPSQIQMIRKRTGGSHQVRSLVLEQGFRLVLVCTGG